MPARGSVTCVRRLTTRRASVKDAPTVDKPRPRGDHWRERKQPETVPRTWASAHGPLVFLEALTGNEVAVEVLVGDSDRLEYVLKKFRRQITKAGLFQDMKRKRFYESPGAQRRRKDKAAARRKAKSARRREHY